MGFLKVLSLYIMLLYSFIILPHYYCQYYNMIQLQQQQYCSNCRMLAQTRKDFPTSLKYKLHIMTQAFPTEYATVNANRSLLKAQLDGPPEIMSSSSGSNLNSNLLLNSSIGGDGIRGELRNLTISSVQGSGLRREDSSNTSLYEFTSFIQQQSGIKMEPVLPIVEQNQMRSLMASSRQQSNQSIQAKEQEVKNKSMEKKHDCSGLKVKKIHSSSQDQIIPQLKLQKKQRSLPPSENPNKPAPSINKKAPKVDLAQQSSDEQQKSLKLIEKGQRSRGKISVNSNLSYLSIGMSKLSSEKDCSIIEAEQPGANIISQSPVSERVLGTSQSFAQAKNHQFIQPQAPIKQEDAQIIADKSEQQLSQDIEAQMREKAASQQSEISYDDSKQPQSPQIQIDNLYQNQNVDLQKKTQFQNYQKQFYGSPLVARFQEQFKERTNREWMIQEKKMPIDHKNMVECSVQTDKNNFQEPPVKQQPKYLQQKLCNLQQTVVGLSQKVSLVLQSLAALTQNLQNQNNDKQLLKQECNRQQNQNSKTILNKINVLDEKLQGLHKCVVGNKQLLSGMTNQFEVKLAATKQQTQNKIKSVQMQVSRQIMRLGEAMFDQLAGPSKPK